MVTRGSKAFLGAAVAALAVFLPIAGILLVGKPLAPHLQFPPPPEPTLAHAPFSIPVFAGLAVAILVTAGIVLILAWPRERLEAAPLRGGFAGSFPWWGWLGALALGLSWFVAWTRLPAFEPVQRHTYPPLWVGFILVLNAVNQWKRGHCLLTRQPLRFLLLFPFSALFWWYFEFLNRFVQNWIYLGVQSFSALEYVLFASLGFSTVLPAVVSMEELLGDSLGLRRFFRRGRRVCCPVPRLAAGVALAVAAVGLALLGLFPDLLFPLLWVSPLLIVDGLRVLSARTGEDAPPGPAVSVFSGLCRGDWSLVVCAAGAALVCGFFWELWNVYSLAKWEYAIAFVERFRVFEMPVLGYAGYLPFGLECHLIAAAVLGRRTFAGG